jgi:hypothetical protein
MKYATTDRQLTDFIQLVEEHYKRKKGPTHYEPTLISLI